MYLYFLLSPSEVEALIEKTKQAICPKAFLSKGALMSFETLAEQPYFWALKPWLCRAGRIAPRVTCFLVPRRVECTWHKGKSLTPEVAGISTSHMRQPNSSLNHILLHPEESFLLALIKIQLLLCITFTNGFDLDMNNNCTTSIFTRLLWESV